MVTHGASRPLQSSPESRPRLKKYGRVTVSWRKAVNGWTSYNYVQGGGSKQQRTQSYMSSAVQQLLMKASAMEASWHSTEDFCTPEKLRLQQYLRTRKLKCDLGHELESRKSAICVLQKAAEQAAGDGEEGGALRWMQLLPLQYQFLYPPCIPPSRDRRCSGRSESSLRDERCCVATHIRMLQSAVHKPALSYAIHYSMLLVAGLRSLMFC
eukprot:6180485-Pleurochrysis_carterae.AAC.5